MASHIVIDSGVWISIVLQESLAEKAKSLLKVSKASGLDLVAPMLFRYEVIAVLRKTVVQGRLTPQNAFTAREKLLVSPILLFMDDNLMRRAYDLATQLNRPTAYDAQYLAVAERFQCEFWTADERLFNAVNNTLPWVKWLGNFADQK